MIGQQTHIKAPHRTVIPLASLADNQIIIIGTIESWNKLQMSEDKQESGHENGTTLSVRVMKGSAWLFSLRVAIRLLDLIRVILLARLLLPADFGLLGAALLAISFFEMVTLMGFETALIQKKEGAEDYLDTAWTMQVGRALIICSGVLLTAPLVADYFQMPQLKSILFVLIATQFLRGFSNIGTLYFHKNMQFNYVFGYLLVPVVVDFTVSVTAAILYRTVWALVAGLIAKDVVGFVLSYSMHPYRPKFNLNAQKANELFNFGKWILGSAIFTYIFVQGPAIIVVKVMGAAALGTYQMAHRIAVASIIEMVRIVSNSVFPAYALMQDNKLRFKEAYMRVSRLILSILFPIVVCMLILARPFSETILGEKWSDIITILKWLAVAGFFRAIVDIKRPYLLAIGRPQFQFQRDTVLAVSTLLTIYPMVLWQGLTGAAISYVFAMICVFIFDKIFLQRKLDLSSSNFLFWLGYLKPLIVATLLCAAVVWIIMETAGANDKVFMLAGISGILVYFGGLYLYEKYIQKSIIFDLIQSIRESKGVD
ncbi:MAG: lipopolysaccharide biosynthesis protein [Bacteroidetes bacterium]|nr:lipopolysaccharide biosynthesis protein [Bacteroidota bacterium]